MQDRSYHICQCSMLTNYFNLPKERFQDCARTHAHAHAHTHAIETFAITFLNLRLISLKLSYVTLTDFGYPV
jgi:uncharacterized paraquat-inducible protein A